MSPQTRTLTRSSKLRDQFDCKYRVYVILFFTLSQLDRLLPNWKGSWRNTAMQRGKAGKTATLFFAMATWVSVKNEMARHINNFPWPLGTQTEPIARATTKHYGLLGPPSLVHMLCFYFPTTAPRRNPFTFDGIRRFKCSKTLTIPNPIVSKLKRKTSSFCLSSSCDQRIPRSRRCSASRFE